MASTIRSRYVMANGVRTHYWESGDNGPVIVALHGGGAGSSGLAGMGPLLERLGDAYRVIAPDSIGGFGRTDAYAPVPLGLMSRVYHLEDTLDALGLDTEKVIVVGNSQGAWTGVQYAIRNPERVSKMVIISSLTIAGSLGIKQKPTPALEALNNYDGTREGMRRILEALIIDKKRITDKLIDDRQATAVRPGALDSFAAFFKNSGKLRENPIYALMNDMTKSLPTMAKNIPTIYIWGDSDTFALPETGREIHKFTPDSKFHWVKGAGHQVQTDMPDETAKIIRDFIQQ